MLLTLCVEGAGRRMLLVIFVLSLFANAAISSQGIPLGKSNTSPNYSLLVSVAFCYRVLRKSKRQQHDGAHMRRPSSNEVV